MKKRVQFILLFMLLIVSIPFLLAENETTDISKVNQAYSCLRNQISEKGCDNLGLEEQIFSTLSVGECKTKLLEAANNNQCWPNSGCNIKLTAQSILALKETGTTPEEAKNWLLDQTISPPNMDWYLQIESDEATDCTVNYEMGASDVTTSINFGEDRKITSISGSSCFSATSVGDYWPEISRSCYNTEFLISCDKEFLTSLIFKKSDSSTIHVSNQASSASTGGTTSEKVESSCFASGNTCDYEASLWSTLTLKILDEEIRPYLPYLITFSDENINKKYLPNSFLYSLTGETDYKAKILGKQILNKYWKESSDKFYDTAVALYPFQDETLSEKTNSIEWLLNEDTQEENGCWDNKDIKNTGFLLYSIWPRSHTDDGAPSLIDCQSSGYYCRPDTSCLENGGDILDQYECSGLFNKCCSVDETQQTCVEKGGEICPSGQECSGYQENSIDISSDQICCISGSCIIPETQSECEINGGTCKLYGCESNEEEKFYSCEQGGEKCCAQKVGSEKSYIWLWILGILIILTIVAIIFKDKLRILMLRIKGTKSRDSRGPKGFQRRPRPPRGMPPIPPRGPIPPRRMHAPAGRKPKGEIDEVLKKLKEMGK